MRAKLNQSSICSDDSISSQNTICVKWRSLRIILYCLLNQPHRRHTHHSDGHKHEADSLGLNRRRNFRQAISLRSNCSARSLAASSCPLWTRLDRAASAWDRMNESSTWKHRLTYLPRTFRRGSVKRFNSAQCNSHRAKSQIRNASCDILSLTQEEPPPRGTSTGRKRRWQFVENTDVVSPSAAQRDF